MAMTKIQRMALELTLEELAKDLDVTPVIFHLKRKEVITDNDEDAINSKSTQEEKVSEFVKLLKKRGTRAFEIFHCYLQDCTGSSHLAAELEENLQILEIKEMKRQGVKKPERMEKIETWRTSEEKIRNTRCEYPTTQSSQKPEKMEKIETWRALEEKFYNIRCEYATIQSYRNIPTDLNIVLIGKTGSGKSSTGNTLLGTSFFSETSSSKSVKKTITVNEFIEGNKVITVIDTPGLFDTDSGFTNEDLLLEIVNIMIKCRRGIHLFLLVCSSNMRFTKEEEDTIKNFEKILTKDVYKNCVLVLTSAYWQFGCKDFTVKKYIAEKKMTGGNFSDVLGQINDRVIAVENFFQDEFLKSQQRQKFLCVLMQVISDNNGSSYSNEMFQYVDEEMEREEKER